MCWVLVASRNKVDSKVVRLMATLAGAGDGIGTLDVVRKEAGAEEVPVVDLLGGVVVRTDRLRLIIDRRALLLAFQPRRMQNQFRSQFSQWYLRHRRQIKRHQLPRTTRQGGNGKMMAAPSPRVR